MTQENFMRSVETAFWERKYDSKRPALQKFARRNQWQALLIAAAVLLPVGRLAAQQTLEFDTPTEAMIDYDSQTWESFQIKVPRDALIVTITIDDSPVDIDLYARHGEEIEDWATDAEFAADSFEYNEVLRISRNSELPLQYGTYYVDVAYILDDPPMVGKERIDEIPFTITASVIRHRVDAALEPGVRCASETTPEEGYFRTFTIEVPEEAEALRIDLDEVTSDMDISARHRRQITNPADADHKSVTLLGRETLVIDKTSDPPLEPGLWYINVFDPVELGSVPFSIYASFSSSAPEALLAIPQIEIPEAGLDRAVRATVEISCPDGAGSGTLLTPDGLILTNFHVIKSASGRPTADGEVVVSLTLDERHPPVELFRGRVVESDEERDMALVEIVSGLYQQPLPDPYAFPYLELGDPDGLGIGSPLQVLGFPVTGGTGSRVSVTYTSGVVSGFESAPFGTIIKTDAAISSGNSGGAALDAECHLIGIPTSVVPEPGGNGQVGYIHPVSAVHESWMEMIESRRPPAGQ
jgi:S1-C subfamily serine protease